MTIPPDVQARVRARIEAFVDAARPQLILLQCGADAVAGDPLTHLQFSPAAYSLAGRGCVRLCNAHCAGRMLAFGGGGYDLGNLAAAWTAVVRELLELP